MLLKNLLGQIYNLPETGATRALAIMFWESNFIFVQTIYQILLNRNGARLWFRY